MSIFGAVGAGAEGAAAGSVVPGVGTVAGGIVGAVSGLLGGTDKNAQRDQQEAARFAAAKNGDLASAQGIYHDSLPVNKQTAERIKDDQAYWQQLVSLKLYTVQPGDTTGSTVTKVVTSPGNAIATGIANIFGQNQNGTGAGAGAAGTQAGLGAFGGIALVGLLGAGLLYAVISAATHKGGK